jgi:NADPH-dependent 2,4-dienoyl-CoA reductase/sulfur reductase-like enzyme/nitrite reductase/ring-hydroxylating ferredoxin subunit
MSETKPAASGPDFSQGIREADIPATGAVAGHVGDTPVLLSRVGDGFSALTAVCTHYGGPLSEGLISGETVRCPWHHACFNLRTGEAIAAPAFDPLERWAVTRDGDSVFVREKLATKPSFARATRPSRPERVVIVGGGAAGFAAAEMLRRRGFDGQLTMLSADSALPCDRPNLSKDYLAGQAPEEWLFLKDEAFYRDNGIDMRLRSAVGALDARERKVRLPSGETLSFDALLLATGAEPVRPQAPGFQRDNVYTLRSVSDAHAIIAASGEAKSAAIAGASFIGLEVAASLRARGLQVHVIAPEQVPMERTMGREIGGLIAKVHQENGVRFRLARAVENFDGNHVLLSNGDSVAADFLVLGIGVRPRISLAREAGLNVDGGVIVDAMMQTSAPGIFAAGDIALYPDPISGERIRVEHWVVAERQGQVAAENILGERTPFRFVPFFWSNHYDLAIRYVGHAAKWDRIETDGSLEARDCTVRYILNDRVVAAASIGRDKQNLEVEHALEAASRA